MTHRWLSTRERWLCSAHHRRQRKERLASAEHGLSRVGSSPRRTAASELKPERVSEYFERLVFAAGPPPIRLHDLRHGAATLYLAAGNDMKTTSAMMRHSNQAITSDPYTSVLPNLARAAAEASAALVPRRVRVGDPSETGGPPTIPRMKPDNQAQHDGVADLNCSHGIVRSRRRAAVFIQVARDAHMPLDRPRNLM
ncbi:tyrosine-type recombinase/integrase [Nonomuraea sp. NPDC048826]|uniref:tyrosine-type recombinase/integrase n=1 Tax=Nonomuraea sp. NPDC048826 TaxID=3364347 RepID=UPI003721D17D